MRKGFTSIVAAALLVVPLQAMAQSGHDGHGMEGDKPTGGMKGMDHGDMAMGKHGEGHGEHMRSMHEKMAELREHSEMMDRMKDGSELRREMRKHMRLMDEMMESMMAVMMEKED